MTDGTAPRPRLARAARPLWRTVAPFLFIVLSLMGASWMIVGVAITPVLPGGWKTLGVLAGLLSVLPLGVFLFVRGAGLYAGRWIRLLVFQPFWYAQFLLLGSAIAALLGVISGLPFGVASALGRLFVALAVAAFLVVAVWGYIESRRLMRRDFEITHPQLPAEFDGLRIVQLSDLHLGPHLRESFIQAVIDCANDARGEVVVVTGDMVDDFPDDVDLFARVSAALEAQLGIYAVPGNHDVYADWQAVHARLRRLPVTLLVNEAITIERNGARLTLLGTGDPAGGRDGESSRASPNIPLAMTHVPAGSFVIALAHNPGLWPALAHRGVPLTLSGHTHWGQLAIPSRNWCFASIFLDFAMGVHQRGDSLLWISPGTGYWGIPFRLGAPGEVTVHTLRAGTSAEVRETAYVRQSST